MSARDDDRYGDFELVKYLAAGGMADLYLAHSPRFENDVVVKKIQMRYVEMTRVVKMFIDEGRIAKALEHPNIVRVLDVGQEGGTYFIAMEFIPGRDLLQICRRGVETGRFLPRTLAVGIIEQALRGLRYAHECTDDEGQPLRIVHCDMSPGNIVVSWRGTAKIVDFGIARATIQLRKEDHSVVGKYNYMAPEQIRGERVDARTDLFTLGIILYEITVGKRLFRGKPEDVRARVLDAPVPRPTSLDPEYPAALERIVMKALERDPQARYDSARAMLSDVRAWLSTQATGCGKRDVAEYLHDVFGRKKEHVSEEFDDADADGGADADELELEARIPSLVPPPLEVDPEDPTEVGPPAHPPIPARPVVAVTPTAPIAPLSSGGYQVGLVLVMLLGAAVLTMYFLAR